MIYAIFAPFILAFFMPMMSKYKHKIHTGFFVLLIPLFIFVYFVRDVGKQFTTRDVSYNWVPSLGINLDFHLDGLSLLFVLLISGIGALVVFYSIFYLEKSERLGQFYAYLLLFMTGMFGVILSDNVFVLYTFWELTSISSFLLIGYWHHKERSRYGALKSMLITIFGGLSMFGGFILLSIISGTTSIQQMILHTDTILNSSYLPLALGFILVGAFTKSAQFPFHIWLPDAMEAPTPVSAYLHSATMVKAGIYLVARFSPIFSAYEWFFIIVSTVGIITLCWGSYMAVRQTDLKAILAFSTISQLGMIMAMLGFGTKAAVFAAVFHILNHATFKGSLFMIAGIIDHETGTRDIRKLGGLLVFMPITAALALFATFSMAGVPLPFLNGFYSKELFFESTLFLNGGTMPITDLLVTIMPFVAVLGSIFTFVYSMYIFFGVFYGKYKTEAFEKRPHEPSIGMLLSPIILVIGVIVIGIFPNLFSNTLLIHAAEAVVGPIDFTPIHFWHGLSTPFIMSLIVVIVGVLLVVTRKKWAVVYEVFPGKFSFNTVYNALLRKSETYSAKINGLYMTGSIRNYMLIILSTIIIVTFGTLFITNGFVIDYSNLADVTIIEISSVIIMVLAAITTIFTKKNLAAILILGVVGFGTAMLFVIYRAPDLALTQLVIETVSVALFLLCFHHLPNLRKRDDTATTKIVNLIMSIGFGGLLTVIAIASHSTNWFDKISDYFVETALTIGGGTNIVNVILVDMRGLDTLFEITVLGIAALAIYGLVKFNKDNKDKEAK